MASFSLQPLPQVSFVRIYSNKEVALALHFETTTTYVDLLLLHPSYSSYKYNCISYYQYQDFYARDVSVR